MKKMVRMATMVLVVICAVMSLSGCSAADRMERSFRQMERDYEIAQFIDDAKDTIREFIEDAKDTIREIVESPWFWIITVIIPAIIGVGGAIFAVFDAPTRGRNVCLSVMICLLFHVFGVLFYVISNVDYPKKKEAILEAAPATV